MTELATRGDWGSRDKLSAVVVDPRGYSVNSDIEQRKLAIVDLVEESSFRLVDRDDGPYILALSAENSRLALHISNDNGQQIVSHFVSLTPLRKAMKDYQVICDVHRSSVYRGRPSHQLEAIDMARRSVHNEASELLMQRLSAKVIVDFETARRLFTLISISFLMSSLLST